uniref:discoidin domain-containing protein n=1 Tax=Nonomuraea bangladeshensis TaxID=404385 RepID=UPI003F492433
MQGLWSRPGLVLSLLAALTAVPWNASATAVVAAPEPGVGVWTEPSSTSVFQDSLPSSESGKALQLDTAINEYESGQVVVHPQAGLTVTSVRFSALTKGVNTIAADNLSYNFLTYKKLNRNTDDIWPTVRDAPGDFPDGLSNLTRIAVPAGVTQSIWVTVYIPKGAAPGRYTGTVDVHTDRGDLPSVPLIVDVRGVTVPDPVDGVFDNALWNTFLGEISWLPPGQTIEETYGFKPFSDKWQQLAENVAAEMKEHRNNNLTLPLVQLLLLGNSTLEADGRYKFDWTYVDKAAEFFMSRNATKRLEGFWVSADVNGDGVRDVETIGRGSDGKGTRSYVPWNSGTAARFIDEFIPAAKAHFESKSWNGKKWSAMYWMHIGDEPTTDAERDSWLNLAARVRSHWPTVKLGDAIYAEPNAQNIARSMDIMIPQTLNYNMNPEPYDTLRAQGKELWLYNATAPRANYLNRFIDQPQWNQRLSMWHAFSRKATGYLHYSLNGWLTPLDAEDGKGDHYLTWPDVPNTKIQSTIRWDSLRDGIEEYEVLSILARTDPGLAKDLSTALIQDADTYTPDTAYMARVRRMLLDAAAGKAVVAKDLARSGATTASSQAPDGAPGNAVDGNRETSWKPASGSSGQRWQVDLGQQVQLDGVQLDWGKVHATAYRIQISYDGVRWADASTRTSGDGGVDFIGVNGKARYAAIQIDSASATPYSLNSFEVTGFELASKNLLGGLPYKITRDGVNVIQPAGKPDSGTESTDGVLADDWSDGRTYGFAPGQDRVEIVFDLGAVQVMDGARVHAYEEFPAYRPDTVQISTSTDGTDYAQKGWLPSTPNDQSRIWYDFSFPPSSARYVKVTFLKTYGGKASAMFIDEIEVYQSALAPADNLALNKPYSKSSNPTSYPDTFHGGKESTDTLIAGHYSDQLGYGYQVPLGRSEVISITLDLGSARQVGRVRVHSYFDAVHRYAPDSVRVYTGTTPDAPTLTATAVVPVGQWFDLSMDPVSTRYVKVEMSKLSGPFADYLFVGDVAVHPA